MTRTHPLESKPDAFPAIVSAWTVAIAVAIGLWSCLHWLIPPIGWDGSMDAPVHIDIGFFSSMWHDIWASAPAIGSIGSIAEFLHHVTARPVAILDGGRRVDVNIDAAGRQPDRKRKELEDHLPGGSQGIATNPQCSNVDRR